MNSRAKHRGILLLTFLAFILLPFASFADSTTYTYDNVNRVIRVESGRLGITATAGSNGSISPSGTVIVNFRGSQIFTITPAVGYHVADVKVNGASVGAQTSYTFSNITAPQTIEAQFAINTYPLNVSLNNTAGGSVTSNPAGISCGANCSATYTHGTVVALTANPNIAYNFTGWSGACTGTGSCIVAMDNAKSVTANFDIKKFTIATSLTGIGGGEITPGGNVIVNYGSNQTFSIGSTIGYTLSDVTVDGISVGPVASYTFSNVTAGHTLTATFTCPNKPVRINRATPVYFDTIQDAYNAAADGETIQVHAVTLTQQLNINRNISVTLAGGHTCTCDFIPGANNMTTLKGQLQTTTGGGTLTIKNFILTQ